nr:MAG: hypothetical protein BECKMB1821I_GA0114274_101512 [Candidatus Kentron sp. MB]VFK75180.1 MAG: hypothetical protein BECKMB1821H_GA0114242_101712 [Candidatus Kentron sp. MB]
MGPGVQPLDEFLALPGRRYVVARHQNQTRARRIDQRPVMARDLSGFRMQGNALIFTCGYQFPHPHVAECAPPDEQIAQFLEGMAPQAHGRRGIQHQRQFQPGLFPGLKYRQPDTAVGDLSDRGLLVQYLYSRGGDPAHQRTQGAGDPEGMRQGAPSGCAEREARGGFCLVSGSRGMEFQGGFPRWSDFRFQGRGTFPAVIFVMRRLFRRWVQRFCRRGWGGFSRRWQCSRRLLFRWCGGSQRRGRARRQPQPIGDGFRIRFGMEAMENGDEFGEGWEHVRPKRLLQDRCPESPGLS